MNKLTLIITMLITILFLVAMAPCDITTAENNCGCRVSITNTTFVSPNPGVTYPQDMNLQVAVSYGLCGMAYYSPAYVQVVAYACDINENPITSILQSDRVEVTGNGSITIQDFEITWKNPIPQNTAHVKVLVYYECAAAPYSDSYEQVFVVHPAEPTPDTSIRTASFTIFPSDPRDTDTIYFRSTTTCSGCNIVEHKWYLDGIYPM